MSHSPFLSSFSVTALPYQQAQQALLSQATYQAQALSASPPSRKKPHVVEQIIPFVFIFLLFYLILIRPAQKRQKKHQALIQQLKKGDSVITNSGILGIIYGLTDTFVTLEVAQNVRIRILRSQISSLAESELSSTKKQQGASK